MKILLATGLYPPDIGGPATYTKMLEEELPQHDIAVHVAQYGWVRRYPKISRHFVFAWKLIRESKGCDVIYALDPVSVGLPAYLAHKLTRKPLFLRVPGDYAWEQGQQRFGVTDHLDEFVGNTKRYHPVVALLKRIQTRVAKTASRVVVPSEYMKGIVHAWGVKEMNIKVIYSALHPLEVSDTKEALRKMLEYDGPTIVTSGRLVPWKGMKTLILLLPKLREEVPNTKLVVIGNGPLESELKEAAEASGVSDSVRFVSRMPKETLGAAIKAGDVFVLNTAYEGMSHQLLEVMDLGVPIVTTSVGGNVELITDGVDGLLTEYDDSDALVSALKRVLTNDELVSQMTKRARLKVKSFERSVVVAELAGFLKDEV